MSGHPPRASLARIESLGHDGRGVVPTGGVPLYVRDALPGEYVRIRVRRRTPDHLEADLVEVLEPSPDRAEPGCPHFGTCGGCTLQHLHPNARLTAMQDNAAGLFSRLGRASPGRWLEPVTGPSWGYRRRARLSVKHLARHQRVVLGFRERDGRFVADLDRCPVLEPAVGERLSSLARAIGGLEACGRIPQVEVACGDNACALVFRHKGSLGGSDRERLAGYGREHGFQVWLQPGGPESAEPLEAGAPPLEYRLADHEVTLRFLPVDFLQVNAEVNASLVSEAVRRLDPEPGETGLDLFCGLGNFSLPLARRAGRVVGVDGDESLVSRARDNATRNGLDNTAFHAADLSRVPEDAEWLGAFPDKVLLDPPRAGARMVLNRFAARRPARIVMVSCHPGTLARDAGFLVNELGYRFSTCRLFDMFPHTAHMELMAVFDRE